MAALSAGNIAAQEFALEEIVVTARKTVERPQKVPIYIASFSANDLAKRGLDDIARISQFTTNFTVEKLNRYGVQGGGARPVIRP